MEKWAAGSVVEMTIPENGEEMFVVQGNTTSSYFITKPQTTLSGDVQDQLGHHNQHTWTRNPVAGKVLTRTAGPNGCVLWFKSGHLASPEIGV